IPLNGLYIFLHFNKGLAGMVFVLIWYALLFTFNIAVTKKVNVFAVITFIMILLNFFTGFLKNHPSLHIIVKAMDQGVMGLIFLGSILLSKPLVLRFVNKETLERIPEKVKKSPYFLKSWNIITAMWGIFYVITGLTIVYLGCFHKELEGTVDFYTGWPATLVLLVISIKFPEYYLRKHRHDIEKE
ncbi:MAG: VC0807 family protein, partial [Candidatus Eremiobacterota bacterium]